MFHAIATRWRAALALLLAGALPALASPTRIAVIYAESDAAQPASFNQMISGMERLPDVEIIRLALDERGATAALLLAARGADGPIRLANAGGAPVGPIAVIYPDIGEPYRSVFSQIIEGIEDRTRARVVSYAVGSSFNAQEVSAELKRQEVRVVIALGRNGLKAAGGLDRDLSVIAGGVVSVPEPDGRGGPVLSLAPDPALLFSRLRSLAPRAQRVFVVYDPRQNAWLIRLAREAAKAQGLELVALEAGDLRSALSRYQTLFAEINPQRDTLWLPQDSTTVEESTVMPLVLQESWAKSVLVFSSSAAHVKRGVLFALYPNNVDMGRNLAASAMDVATSGGGVRGIQPLRDVLTAFNTRTASHLGVVPPAAVQKEFGLVFPAQ